MKGFFILKTYVVLFSLFLFCFVQSKAQQVVNANIINNSGTTELDLIEPTDIDTDINFEGEVLHNQVDLYRLDTGEEGAAQWVLDFFTPNETVYFKLSTVGNNAISYSLQLNNEQIEAFRSDNPNSSIGSTSFVNGDYLRIERNDGHIIGYKNAEVIFDDPNAPTGVMFATMVVLNTGTQTGNRPNITFTFPEPVLPIGTPSGGDPRTYTKLKKQLDGSYVQLECAKINFQYIEDYAITTNENDFIKCKIYDWQRNPVFNTSLANVYGVNWQNIEANNDLVSNTFYTLEVTGANKGEKYKLRVKTGDVTCPNPPSN